jgi:hypothetical protein
MLAADADIAGVPFDLGPAQDAVEHLNGLVLRGEAKEATEFGEQLTQRLAVAENDLEESIDRISQRRQLLASIVDVLPSLGMSVERDSLIETTDGTMGIRAQRFNGDHVAVVVQEAGDGQHRIFYHSAAMAEAEASGGDVRNRGCDTLVEFAEQVNGSLSQGGFQAGEVDWDGRDGRRPPVGGRQGLVPSQSTWQMRR